MGERFSALPIRITQEAFKSPDSQATCQANWSRASGGGAQGSGIFQAPQGLQCSAVVESQPPSLPWQGFYEHCCDNICSEKEGVSHMLSASYASDPVLGASLILKLYNSALRDYLLHLSGWGSSSSLSKVTCPESLKAKEVVESEGKAGLSGSKACGLSVSRRWENEPKHAMPGWGFGRDLPVLNWFVQRLCSSLSPEEKSMRRNKSGDTGSKHAFSFLSLLNLLQ